MVFDLQKLSGTQNNGNYIRARKTGSQFTILQVIKQGHSLSKNLYLLLAIVFLCWVIGPRRVVLSLRRRASQRGYEDSSGYKVDIRLESCVH